MSNLIIGCGYLGRRVAKAWLAQGKRVQALTRGNGEELRALGIEPLQGDILGALPDFPQAETVLYAVGMDRSSGRSFREVYINGLRNVLDVLPTPTRLIHVSSTSVYGQTNGEEVDEHSPTEPVEENGQIVLEAERLLRSRIPDAMILRFAGIYGPDRVIRRAAIEKGEPLKGDADKWLNLIHVEDGVRAVLAAEERGRSGETYLVADDQPVRRRDFYSFLATLLGAPPAQFEPLGPGQTALPHESGNRRTRNWKLREELEVALVYPQYQEGLRAALEPMQ
ncbi:MAG: SDR family oxidoreductase [Planctomycetes bacterium]|nr:SDR family oxidoreductase [Planctomycetota bacterium]